MIAPVAGCGVERLTVGEFRGDARLHEARAVEQPRGERAVDETVLMVTPVAALGDNAMGFQERQMLGCARRRDAEALGQRGHVKTAGPQLLNEAHPVGMRHHLQEVCELASKNVAERHNPFTFSLLRKYMNAHF